MAGAVLAALHLPPVAEDDDFAGSLKAPSDFNVKPGKAKKGDRGFVEANHEAAMKQPELLSLADAFRCAHSVSMQLVCLQGHVFSLFRLTAVLLRARAHTHTHTHTHRYACKGTS